MVGRLKNVDLREIWKHEAHDFTGWLFANCDVLGEKIGISLTAVEKEKSVGPFYVDILAEDENGHTVVIENQLTKTDHDHLGKVVTYLVNLNAKIAIWISTDPRPEHIASIEFLNEVVPKDIKFYLIEVEAFKIGDSEPAPHFTIKAGPSPEKRAKGKIIRDIANTDSKKFEFFSQLLEQCNKETTIFNNISPVGYQFWIQAGAGKGGTAWQFIAMKKISRVVYFLYSASADVNKKRFHYLLSHKDEIEKQFGDKLVWDFKENRKQHYLMSICNIGGLDDEEKWPVLQNELVSRLVRFEKALKPFISSLPS